MRSVLHASCAFISTILPGGATEVHSLNVRFFVATAWLRHFSRGLNALFCPMSDLSHTLRYRIHIKGFLRIATSTYETTFACLNQTLLLWKS